MDETASDPIRNKENEVHVIRRSNQWKWTL